MSSMSLSVPRMRSGVREDAPDAISLRPSRRSACAAGMDLDVLISTVQLTADVLLQNMPRYLSCSVGWSASKMR
eukprot:12169731-Ditylum_brightwellii.AAC.1